MQSIKNGFYIVPTPIGNLKDITLRAIETLKNCDLIYCEDTRVSKRLLDHYQISTKLLTYHEHNASQVRPKIIEQLLQGLKIALISDAGMPLICDPGYKLLNEIKSLNINYTVLPGACALINGLCLSGFSNHNFFFAGFFKKNHCKEYINIKSSIIFYESPNRVIETVKYLQETFKNRKISIIREISKIHEEVICGTYQEVLDELSKRDKIYGEIVIVLDCKNNDLEEFDINDIEKNIKDLVLKKLSTKDITDYLIGNYNINKKDAYKIILNVKDKL